MARLPHDTSAGQSDSSTHSQSTILDANAGNSLTLPGHQYITDAQMLRDGQDLVLHPAHGPDVIVKNYFTADPAPVLTSADGGTALTHDLVDSFVKPIGGIQYAQTGSMDDSSPVGIVKEASGDGTITHANGTVQKAAIGVPIYEGDIVETKEHGAVNITFVDKTTFAVSENAKMAIDQYVFDPSTQHGENNFSVLRGVFVFTSGLIGHADPDDVKIVTPVGSIGIRGTTIMGTINPGGDSHVSVVEGAIVVSNAAGEQTLSQQFETVKLNGMNQPMTAEGVLSADTMANNYNVLRTVSGPLFSTFDDMGKSEDQPGQNSAPAQDAAPSTDDAPAKGAAPDANAPVNKSDASDPAATDTPATLTQITLDETKATLDSGFDTSAGLNTTSTFSNDAGIAAAATTTTAISAASIAVTSNAGFIAPPATTTPSAAAVAPAVPVTTTAPPVSTGGTTAGNTANPAPDFDLSLNLAIAGNAAGTNFIPSVAAGSQHGYSLTALGDYNHDGRNDYAFANNRATGGNAFIDDGLGNHYIVNLAGGAFGFTDTSRIILSSAGDFNGDGTGDVVIGGYLSDSNGQFTSGKVFVMTDPAGGGQGVNIIGFNTGNMAGFSVSGIGDFNGDGYNDILIGAPYTSGTGSAYVIFGRTGLATIDVGNLTIEGFALNGTAGFGNNVSGIGDFNHDGYSDFAVSDMGSNRISFYYGNANGVNTGTVNVTGLATGATPTIVSMGDANGDGSSDFGILDNVANRFYAFNGGTGRNFTDISVTGANYTFTPSSGTIISAASVGDFNGDGLSDTALAIRNGSNMDIYVVYGSSTLSGTIDPLTVNNAYYMHLDLTSSQFNLSNPSTDLIKINLSSGGDLNGDGYDDLLIGMPNIDSNGGAHSDDGGVLIVNGQSNGATQSLTANASFQSLLGTTGNNNMTNATEAITNISFNGGAGNDTFIVYGSNGARLVDGGTGIDNLYLNTFNNTYDMRSVDLSNIERITLAQSNQTLTLRLDQVFNLLHTSENHNLYIDTSMTGTGLTIDLNKTGSGMAIAGFTDAGVAGNYHAYTQGGYTLYVDTDITLTAANV